MAISLKSALNKIVPLRGKVILTDWMITPFSKRSDFPEKLTIYHKITIFYERVTGWQLDIADKIANDGIKDAGFAVLNVLLNYFEMIAKYKEGYCGIRKSPEYFSKGFKMVFPELCRNHPWLSNKIYSNARCGLYHHGMTEGGIILMGGKLPPITPLKNKNLIITPHALVLELKEHFETYIKQLLDDQGFRTNFEKRFDKDNK